MVVAVASESVYGKLTGKFDETFTLSKGGVDLSYITGEQATTRLNEVLGVDGWSFRIVEHGLNSEADEVWVLGELTAYFSDPYDQQHQREVVRQQFGSQQIKRRRDTGQPLDVGFDLKGATTDALKKCASLIGVGLYLSERQSKPQSNGYSGTPPRQNGAVRPSTPEETPSYDGPPIYCQACQAELQTIRFRDGTTWTPQTMAEMSRKKDFTRGRTLCMDCYRKAKNGQDPFGGEAPEPVVSYDEEY